MRDMTVGTESQHSLAILDDYASIATPYFRSTPTLVVSFPNTIPPIPEYASDLIARLSPYTIISTMRERTRLPASVISQLPNLRLLLTTGTRNAAIDLQACTERNIVVAGTTGAGRSDPSHEPAQEGYDMTTQQNWALILALANRISTEHLDVRNGGWQSGFNTGLAGKTLGLLGLGRLGSRTARVGAIAFGMKVTAWSSSLTQEKVNEVAKRYGITAGEWRCASSKEEVCRIADVLSLHYVLSERSRGMIGKSELGVMKPEAILINTSRGDLIDEGALLETLRKGGIKGCGMDVFWREPLAKDDVWRTEQWGKQGRSLVVLSPHMGYVEEGLMTRWYEEQAENVKRWVKGQEIRNRMN